MIIKPISLRVAGLALITIAFLAGALSVWAWMHSRALWNDHRASAYIAGLNFHTTFIKSQGSAAPVRLVALSSSDLAAARDGNFKKLSLISKGFRETFVPVASGSANTPALALVALSPDLVYPLAEIKNGDGQSPADLTGQVFRLLASYCSQPVVLARLGTAQWWEVKAEPIWDCRQAPKDWRLIVSLVSIVFLAALITMALNISGHFLNFANLLNARRRVGGPESYQIPGPEELQLIVSAMNSYFDIERKQLENRAAILSGVSHDLGTPAARLRLRTALIPEKELREKFHSDIDEMTSMIESVLTYTRAEISDETPRRLSISALIEAIAADYQDVGKDVKLIENPDLVVQSGSSVFMSRQGRNTVRRTAEKIAIARPILLRRAISNLIDNAIKFGQSAELQIISDANCHTIIVTDSGSLHKAEEMGQFLNPYQRGDHGRSSPGFGMGLAIVSTIANVHGGSLSFEDTEKGLRALLRILRS